MSPRVQTVLGDVKPEDLGVTLTHEHLAMDFTHFYRKPPKHLADRFYSGISLPTAGYLRQYPYSSKYNLELNDQRSREALLNDVAYFKNYGGGTIVENSTEGLDRDLALSVAVSHKTGVHIVAGTGFYIADLQPADHLHSSTEELYNHMLNELTAGCVEKPDVKAGFMGEIASVWPLRDFEIKAIKAAGTLQPDVDCGVSFHPHRVAEAPFEIVRLYLEAGGKADKLVMSHLDRTLLEPEKLLEFAELGVYCQFDLFGVEVSYYQLNVDTDMPSDAQRIDLIKTLVDEGKEDRVLMSHDIHTKHRLVDFGGHGYSHIINNILPRMKTKGFSQATIDKITIDNPARWLTIDKDY
ncbi:phosphotriesterase-related protein [Ostrinia furnacalis]|uniref:phosphotriesterase-related protein n=1 Tax=Ostrinia furnacalis TaxID=93504 RepID=UPI00103F7A33|nr:phosphotriesterase-related protein [Ostrinia furnacalis]